MLFILKPGNESYNLAKSFGPLHPKQHAYKKGKLLETICDSPKSMPLWLLLLRCVPGYENVLGNARTDKLARDGVKSLFYGYSYAFAAYYRISGGEGTASNNGESLEYSNKDSHDIMV